MDVIENNLVEKKRMIIECLKMEIELKRLESEWGVKKERNLKMKQNNKVLEDKLMVLKKPEINDERWQVIEVKECRVVLGKGNESEMKTTDQQTSKKIVSSDNKFQCQHPGCGRKFTYKSSLVTHMNVHNEKYPCQVCQKCFPLPSQLENHFLIHTGERPFVCDWIGCGKRFNNKGNLERHNKTHSQFQKFRFSCDWVGCGALFDTNYDLKQHNRKHLDDRPFHCNKDGCGKSFNVNAKLQEHLMTHSSIRLFRCQVEGCEKRFKNKSDLARHVKGVHNNVREFRCDFENCEKAFHTREHLKRHLLIHQKFIHSDREFRCPFENCQRIYKYCESLNRHLKKIH